MFILEMFEGAGRRVVVTYPGRFQPFHLGHADVFRSLQSRFGSDNVFIVTGNKTDGDKSPFNFSDKVRFMHAAGIPDHSIIEASKPYDLPDQFQADKENIIFITAVGAPDAKRLNPGSVKKDGNPSYFQQLPESFEQAESADKHGYVIIADERAKQITVGGQTVDVSHGTACRNLWNQIRGDEKKRAEFIKQLYGKADMSLGAVLDKIPDGAAPAVAAPSPKLKKVKASVPDMAEGWFDTAKKAATWFLTKDGDVIRTVNGEPFTFKSKEEAVQWAMRNYKVSYDKQRIIPTTNPDKNLITGVKGKVGNLAGKVAEDAAAVGVVRDGNDPRYSMATMGDQNDVTGDTLNQMMRGYNLIGKKGAGKLKPVKGNVGKGLDEATSAGVRMQRALQREKEKREFSQRYAEKHFPIGKPKEEPKKEQGVAEGDKLYKRHQELRKQSGLPDPEYYKELGRKKQEEIDALRAEIEADKKRLGKDIAEEIRVLRKELSMLREGTDPQHLKELQDRVHALIQIQEGWKSKLAALSLAGAAALSPMHAQADAYDDVMQPIRQVQKFKRDIGNAQRNAEHDISAQRNRVGRDLEQIPFFGIDKFGRAVRGSTNHPELQRDPAWDDKVQAAKEKREAQRREREERMQSGDREEWNQRNGVDESTKFKSNKYKITKESASGGATGAGAIASAPTAGAGSLFGGSYEQAQNPFRKKGKKKK